MSSRDLDALDLDADSLAALSVFETDAAAFAELGAARPGDDALVQRMAAHAQSSGVGGSGGASIGAKAIVLAAVVATAGVIGAALWSTGESEVPNASTAAPTIVPDSPPPSIAPRPIVVPPAPQEPAPTTSLPPPTAATKRATAATPRLAEPATTAAELLREGNAARSAGEHERARDLYQRLRREFPGTREDLLVRVSLGRLALERLDDPTLALRQFTAYLADRPHGTLAEEASLGRIAALRRLGKASEEARAIDRFLAAFPDSFQVQPLQQRRAALVR